MKKLLFVSGLILLISACAHHRDVRPGADGVHRVVIATDDQEAGARDAISQANHYCKESNRSAAFVSEDKKYVGTMDEGNYKAAKAISKAATAAGGTVYAMGAKKESNIGGIVGLGGGIANDALGKGYNVEMKFKCQ